MFASQVVVADDHPALAEFFEDDFALVRRYPDPRVGDLDLKHSIAGVLGRDGDAAAFGRELDRVGQQVQHDLLEFPLVGAERTERAIHVETGRDVVGLAVDELLEQHQVVIKSLEANYRKVPDVSGATIMGDGRVALILDVIGRLAELDPRDVVLEIGPGVGSLTAALEC